jgi:hypothetical protein
MYADIRFEIFEIIEIVKTDIRKLTKIILTLFSFVYFKKRIKIEITNINE